MAFGKPAKSAVAAPCGIRETAAGIAAVGLLLFGTATASADSLVALGASNTYGKGVAREEAYPAQLETLLRGKGYHINVVNAGVNGNTTGGMLSRLDQVLRQDTVLVILQPGRNDQRKGVPSERAAIESRLMERGIKFVVLENQMLHDLPHQSDGEHLTPQGYHRLAEMMLPLVTRALAR